MGLLGGAAITFVAVVGLLVGSFLNVVIYRVPRECLSVWRQTRSRCTSCGYQLSWFDNIPVLSWVVLGGRCRSCRAWISARYPLIELLTSVSFLGLAWFGLGAAGWEYPFDSMDVWVLWAVRALVVATLISLSVIDIDYRILPDVITKPSIVLAPLLVFCVPELMPGPEWTPVEEGPFGWTDRWNALINGVVWGIGGGVTLWLLGWLGSKAFRKPAMGLGDVKLFAGMGGLLGPYVLLALILASLAGSVVGTVVLVVRRDRYVPFGPFLAFGAVVCLLAGVSVWDGIMERVLAR